MREALCRTACVSYVALEACEVATQTSWDPQECGTYRDLLNREERRLNEAFGNMMPEELPGPIVAAAEVWLEDARDNVSMAHTWMAARRDKEEKRVAATKGPPEPPDGGTPAEATRQPWARRALQQTSCVSHMAQEICDDSTKASWTSWTYREYRRLLDEEMVAVCQIYMEVGLANLPVREGKEAKEWLIGAHRDAERTRGHIGARIRRLDELKALLSPGKKGLQQKRALRAVFWETEGASVMSRRRARGAANRARSQANKTLKVTTEFPGSKRKMGGGSDYQHVSDKAEVDLVDSTSESGTSDPGGMPQLLRGPRAPGNCPPKAPRMLPRRQMAARRFAQRPVVVAKPRKKTGGPTLLRKLESEISKGRSADNGVTLRITQRTREDDGGKVTTEMAMQEAEEPSTTDNDEGSSGFRPALRARADSSPVEVGDGNAEAPTPEQPPGEGDEFARELASTMRAIANLVVKASGRSVSNGGWLYFIGAREDSVRSEQSASYSRRLTTGQPRRSLWWTCSENGTWRRKWPATSKKPGTCKRHGGCWMQFMMVRPFG